MARFVEIIEAKVFQSDSSLICYCTLFYYNIFCGLFVELRFLKRKFQ